MKRLLALSALAVFAACGEQAGQKAEEPAAAEAPALNLRIGPQGAAGINAALPMDLEAVAAAAPGYVAAPGEGGAITLSLNDAVVFTLLPTADGARLHSIVTTSAQAQGPLGDVVNATAAEHTPGAWLEFCRAETWRGTPGFACSSNEFGNFWRVFQLPSVYDGPHAPFEAIDPDMLAVSPLVEMRWVAPAS